ncbi:MAG: ribonuclease III, partial [Atribacterota bacterium]
CFKDSGLLEKTLIHTSYHKQKEKENINYFQRLEFLGDSVLNLVVSEYLYKKFPFFSEGKLSKTKSVIISQHFLVKFADHLKLDKYVILGKSVDLIRGRGKFSILADCMEACFGAIYLDGGLEPCKKIIGGFISNELNLLFDWSLTRDHKTILQEITQKNLSSLPDYKVSKEEGLEHQKKFFVEVIIDNKIYGKGVGKNKKEAEQDAACQAIKKIKSHREGKF